MFFKKSLSQKFCLSPKFHLGEGAVGYFQIFLEIEKSLSYFLSCKTKKLTNLFFSFNISISYDQNKMFFLTL